jgi:hypothetical protein
MTRDTTQRVLLAHVFKAFFGAFISSERTPLLLVGIYLRVSLVL